jgi:hypothetical protein
MSRVTYDAGNLTIGLDGLDTVAAALGELRKKTPAAANVAINTTARQARQLMIAQARARYAVNAAGRRHLKDLSLSTGKGHLATNSNLEAVLYISTLRNDLGYFEHQPTQAFTGRAVLARKGTFYSARVLRANNLEPLTGTAHLSKGFLVEFKSGHVGMVQRVIGSSSQNTVTQKSGAPRWRNAAGNVEKLQTMGSPSATAMHNVVWPMVEPEVEGLLQANLQAQVERIIEREAARGRK